MTKKPIINTGIAGRALLVSMEAATAAHQVELACEILRFEIADHQSRLDNPLSAAAINYLERRTKLIQSSMSSRTYNSPEEWTGSGVVFKTDLETAQERYDALKVTYEIR